MTTTTVATIYAAALHLVGIVAVVVLLATNHIDQQTGTTLLAGLLGLGAGAGLALVSPTPGAPIPATPAPGPAGGAGSGPQGATPSGPPSPGGVTPSPATTNVSSVYRVAPPQ